VGAVGCVTLMATLPVGSVLSGLGMLLVGVGYRLHRLRRAG
jgi:APA family basic amino acid/polyamine antiporter